MWNQAFEQQRGLTSWMSYVRWLALGIKGTDVEWVVPLWQGHDT
jgi:hypothetical protein